MNSRKCPASVLILAFLYVAVGVIGFSYHFPELMAHQHESVWIEVTELLAIISGIFILRGHNWARWVALAWMAFHVVISFSVFHQLAIHFLLFMIIAWILFRSETGRYFIIQKRNDH